MRKLFVLVLVGAALLAVGVRAQAPKKSTAPKPVLWAAGDLKWVDNPAMKGAQQAVLWGDPAKGGFGALKKIAGGTVLPMHMHTNTMREVILAGTISLQFEGGAAKDLGPQSYTMVPGGVKHTATCKAGADCVYFETSTGAYDLKTEGTQ